MGIMQGMPYSRQELTLVNACKCHQVCARRWKALPLLWSVIKKNADFSAERRGDITSDLRLYLASGIPSVFGGRVQKHKASFSIALPCVKHTLRIKSTLRLFAASLTHMNRPSAQQKQAG